eukprot:m.418903 g.418903  ORF g.418903 m.418903 type:complete len:230 (-) comp21294_c1_seq10:2921-3610(-)
MPGEETATDSPTAVDNISARTASYMESKFGTIVKEDEDVGAMNRSARMGTSPEEGIKHVSAKKSNVPLVTQVVDLKSYEGSNIDAKIASMTSKHGVVVFSKSFCPFCIEVKKTFQALNVPIHVFEVNVAPSGAHVHNSLKALTKHTTMPNVFIKGKHVGGCDDVKALQSTGALDEMLNDLVWPTKSICICAATQSKNHCYYLRPQLLDALCVPVRVFVLKINFGWGKIH